MKYSQELKPINNILISKENLYLYLIDSYERTATIKQENIVQAYSVTEDNVYIQDLDDSVTITEDK